MRNTFNRVKDSIVFAKVFEQIFDSSIAEDYNCRRMFIDLLVLADSTGAVDMTHEAISRRTNVPVQEVVKYVKQLCQPDNKSRSKLEEGKRLVPLDSGRDWGWRIVNYVHYRKIRDEAARREYFRDKQREHRKKGKKAVKDVVLTEGNTVEQVLTPSSTSSSVLKKGESEGEVTPENIYAAYPLKKGKPDAIRAIQKAMSRGTSPDVLLERTQAFAKARNGDLSFCPNPATWFNGERYNDDPSTWIQQTKSGSPQKPKGTDRMQKYGIPI